MILYLSALSNRCDRKQYDIIDLLAGALLGWTTFGAYRALFG
jgi:hypothetical protein